MPRKPAQSNPAVGIVPVVRNEVVPLVRDDSIQSLILTVRGAQVLLDRDLATLYGVPTKALNQAVKRNAERFPPDFMFQLTREECSRSQIVTMNAGRGSNLKYLPYAFTENGVAMLSGVLRSSTAVPQGPRQQVLRLLQDGRLPRSRHQVPPLTPRHAAATHP